MPSFRTNHPDLSTHTAILEAISDKLMTAKRYIAYIEKLLKIDTANFTRETGNRLLNKISSGNEAADNIQFLFEKLCRIPMDRNLTERERQRQRFTEKQQNKVYYEVLKALKTLDEQAQKKLMAVTTLASQQEEEDYSRFRLLQEEDEEQEKRLKQQQEQATLEEKQDEEEAKALIEVLKQQALRGEERARQFSEVAKDAMIVHQLFGEMSDLIDSHDEPVQILVANTDQALVHVTQGHDHLKRASLKQTEKQQQTRCVVMITIMILVMMFLLVLSELD